MKTTISLFIGLLLLLLSASAGSKEDPGKNNGSQQGSVSIMSTPDLFPLTSKWADEYNRLHPGMQIKVINAPYENIDLGANENLSFIANKSQTAVQNQGNWKMVVGRAIIVPAMNAGNPFMNEILKRGISADQFAQMIINPEKQNWGTLLGTAQNAPVHIFMVNDETVKAGIARFIQVTQMPDNSITMGNSDEVIAAVQKDPYAIGFCKVSNILNPENQSLVENIRLLPVDKNGNGSLDQFEDIYHDMALFQRGVWIGKYPRALYSNIFAISKVPPSGESELAFLRWVLTDGQQYLDSKGYSELVNSESQSQLDMINTNVISIPPTGNANLKGLLLLIILTVIALMVMTNMLVTRFRNKKTSPYGAHKTHSPGFDENAVIVPNGLYFDKTHTWAFMEKDGTVAVGIDDFIQHVTGPITRVEMKSEGDTIKKGDLLVSLIQSGKQLNIYAPVSGTIKKQNEALITHASYLNTSPYTEGWVYLIEPLDWFKEIQLLDMAGKYKRWLNTEFTRVKDFLAATLKHDDIEYAYIVLQDGGMLKDGVLSGFGPKTWEDFQTKFLDNYR